jgi:hypothetical protein
MSNATKVTEQAYAALRTYVRRVNANGTFDTNTLRSKLTTVKGLKAKQLGGVIGTAVRRGLIRKIGESTSSNPLHNSGKVGVYTRSYNSF